MRAWFALFFAFTCGFSLHPLDNPTQGVTENWNLFVEFQLQFKKFYESEQEMIRRFNIFQENKKRIEEHNQAGNNTFQLGINRFTDHTTTEYLALLTHRPAVADRYTQFGCHKYNAKNIDNTEVLLPVVDWRNNGVVNAVRDQGNCGSCWAFAATSNAESAWALKYGKLYDMSEEYLVDCATGFGYFNAGCDGGIPESAFKYMIQMGQYAEEEYPYTSGEAAKSSLRGTTCNRSDKTKLNVHFDTCFDVEPGNQMVLQHAVYETPVVVGIDAGSFYFQSYSSGVITDVKKCGQDINHAVEIVGYGEENGILYWLVRNSWGADWGEDGYVKIERSESTEDIGVCGIASGPSFIYV